MGTAETGTTAEELAPLFREAGAAHHQAYLATDGEDPEWPIWYARYLHQPLNERLGSELTMSEIVFHLVAAARTGGDGDWTVQYAQRFLDATS